jgi:hypothetical protein
MSNDNHDDGGARGQKLVDDMLQQALNDGLSFTGGDQYQQSRQRSLDALIAATESALRIALSRIEGAPEPYEGACVDVLNTTLKGIELARQCKLIGERR